MKKSFKSLILLTAIAMGAALSGCDSWINDEEGDCSVHYRVPFTFTMNMLDADAFSSQVTSVTLYVFDAQGNLALRKTDRGQALAQSGYAMDVELKPGQYSMVAWAEGTPVMTPATSFAIGGGENPASISAVTATLPLLTDTETSKLYCAQDITPLFHGYSEKVALPNTYGTVTLPAIDLTKDTNIIEVVLQNINGFGIADQALTVSIEASNSELAWDNDVTGNTTFSYRPWSVQRLTTETTTQSVSRDGDDDVSYSGLMTELTVGRLMTNRKPMLVVHRNSDNVDIIRLDLIKYLLLVKGHYPGGMTDQQYLDRMDRHVLTFFVDNTLNWYTVGGININGWKVVLPWDQPL